MPNTTALAYALEALRSTLSPSVDGRSLYARSPTVHKWKAPWRALLLRETVAWRIQDLLQQSNMLSMAGSILGARILLRSAFETLAVLIYLNQNLRSVVAGELDFHVFSEKTTNLLLGSRDKSTSFESINILTILRGADKRYPGLEEIYGNLSESAHPNCEGMLLGYSKNDMEERTIVFENKWNEKYGNRQAQMLMLCLGSFEHEYNDEFTSAFEILEKWIENNDAILEASKPDKITT